MPPAIAAIPEAKAKFETCMQNLQDLYNDLTDNYGIENEDARYVLPNAAETKIVCTFNARSLYNFLQSATVQAKREKALVDLVSVCLKHRYLCVTELRCILGKTASIIAKWFIWMQMKLGIRNRIILTHPLIYQFRMNIHNLLDGMAKTKHMILVNMGH